MSGWESIADYKPKAESDDFGVFKANGLECSVEYARIEPYKGDREDLKDAWFFRYELSIIGGTTDFLGRKLWGSYKLNDEEKLKKLKNLFFTALGVDLKNQADLEANLEAFASKTYIVRAWGWKPDDATEARQIHSIKGQKKEYGASDAKVAF